MVFEFLKWRASFEEHERGVRKGELTYKRPRPFFDLKQKTEWLKFLVMTAGGSITAGICGIVAYFVVSGIAGGLVWNVSSWVWLFIIIWILFWILHLVHSLRFYRIAGLTDVEFVPLAKAEAIGKRLLTMPEDLTAADYNIFFSRSIRAGVVGKPYEDVTGLVEWIESVQSGGRPATVGGGDFAESIGETVRTMIGDKYLESQIEAIEELTGGIPSPQEIVKIQTGLVSKFRDSMGEHIAMLYLLFLATQPPILPYDESTSRGEMRAVATASDTIEVIGYLNEFAQKMEET